MKAYSKEEAAQAPNQWWDVWDFFPNVSQHQIENPYQHEWQQRPEQVEANYNEDGTLKESLRLNLAGWPTPKYTREGDLYYHTVQDDEGNVIPSNLSNETWREKLPYPFGKKRNNMSDYAFASWLANQAPAQLAPIGALAKGIPNIINQRRTSPHGFYKEGSIDANMNQVDNVLKLSRFKNTHKQIEKQGLYPKGDDPSLTAQQLDLVGQPGFTGEEYAFQSTIQQGKNESNEAYIKRYWNTKFDELGIPEGVRFSLREMLDSDHLTKAQRRNIKAGISNPNYVFRDYKESRQILVNDFLDGLEAFGIDPSTIEIHHISSLRHVSQLFEGLKRSEWPEMLAELYKAGLATGNDPNNLMAMFAKAHRSGRSSNVDSVHQYLDNELGKYNERITGDFGDNIRELSVKERIPSITRYAQVRQSSVQVANNAIRQVLDEIVQSQEGSMDALIDNVVFSQPQIEYIQSKIKQHLDMEFNPQGWGALEDAVKDNVSGAQAKQDRGLSPSGPTQGQLMDLGKKNRPKPKSRDQKKYEKDTEGVPPTRGEGDFPETGEGLDEFGNPL